MAAPDIGWRLAGVALAWLAGVAGHLQQSSLAALPVQIGMLLGGVLLVVLALSLRWRARLAMALVGAALAGFGASGWQACLRLADRLDPALEGRDLVVTGIVASLPQQGDAGLRFRFEVDAVEGAGRAPPLPRLLALGWYRGAHEDAAVSGPQRELRAGQRWRWTVRLRQPHGNLNPYGYDYELSLFEQGVRATGYVRDGPVTLLEPAAGYRLERWRQRVRDGVYASIPDRRVAGIIAALVVGDQGAIEREDWDIFRDTGVAHLMSISGLHITMFAWLAGLLIGLVWRRLPRAAMWLPTPQAARWGGLVAALAYAAFSGWGVPSQRTVWMLATVTVLRSGGVRWPWPLVLLVAAVVVSALDPWALLQAGFWLSFMAVGLLMASSPVRARKRAVPAADALPAWRSRARWSEDTLRAALRTQLIATVGLTPLSLVFFQQVSVIGFVANLVAIPLVTLVITPLSLLGAGLVPLWSLAAWVVQWLVALLELLARVPGAVWRVPAAPGWAQALGLLAAVVLVLPLPWRVRLAAPLLAVPLLLPARSLPAPGEFDLLALDVGQGTAVVVRTHDHLLVYDAGPQYSRDSDAGTRVVLPLLRARGEARIDRLILSHRDLDHVGGARALLTSLAVDEVTSSLDAGHPLLRLAPHTTRCQSGQAWSWDGVLFEMLRPEAGDYTRATAPKPNALSCVLRLSTASRSALLAGDIEREQEAALVAGHPDGLASDVLVVPHHGSRTSSTAEFIEAVAPSRAVFQAGYRSRFGHPAADVVERYRQRGIAIAASPACGAWHWPAAGEPSCHRQEVRRYWHHVSTAAAQ